MNFGKEEVKYTRVRQSPGGQSSFSLAWESGP